MEQSAIPVFRPHLGVDTLKAVTDAFDDGWIGMGATTRRFEAALESHLGRGRNVVATMTGTAALHLGLRAAGVGPGDEVIVASFNYIADVQAIVMAGATPVFCDVDDRHLGLDPTRVVELITPRTRAVMPLHFGGVVGDLDAIFRIACDHKLRVVEDATHALGSSHGGRPVGGVGDVTCFSFDPVKIITCLDGGAVVCGTTEELRALHRLRLLGKDRDTAERYRNSRAWDYDVVGPGFRDHMTNINAAIGLSQLGRLEEFVANRRRDCAAYDRAFADLEWLRTPGADWEATGPFLYTVRVAPDRRDAFVEHLRGRDVATGIHFMPCHEKTFCRDFRHGPMIVTDRIAREIVTLPLWSTMPRDVRNRVIDAVTSFEPAPTLIPAS